MTHKEIVQFLKTKPNSSIAAVYENFSITTPKEKAMVKKLFFQMKQKNEHKPHKHNINEISIKRKTHNTSKRENTHEKSALRYTDSAEQDLPLIKEKYQLPNEFNRDIERELDNSIWEKDQSLEHHRQDLSDLFVITIDGEDSKDLDDAVSLSKSLFGGWELGVHIADVSHYVPQHSALDKEALDRANSYYFINKVTPMLPQKLSNELCSLNPHEQKKAMSIFINFDHKGNVKKYKITPSLIKTSYRMSYNRVEEIIKGDKDKDPKLQKTVELMNTFFRILHQKRIKSGSIDFNFKEKKIVLDDQDMPIKIYQKDRLDAERLIEEFMLVANQVAGDLLTKNGMGLYRVHDIPPSEKYLRLKNFAAKRGCILPEIPSPKDLQVFIESLIGSPLQMSGEILTLRSMAQAVYQQENIGHFGLGFELYAHFTSPIRRYADLVVHRLIKYYLFKKEIAQAPYTREQLDEIAQHISAQERVAMEAERDLHKIKSIRYMKPFEGENFQGRISSVAYFGIFVEIPTTGIEAMIRYTDMTDYIIFNEDELSAHNRSKSKMYKIGMPITFRITKVNIERGFIDAEEIDSNKSKKLNK